MYLEHSLETLRWDRHPLVEVKETLWKCVRHDNGPSVLVGVVYRKGDSNIKTMKLMQSITAARQKDCPVVIVGDLALWATVG